MTTTVSIEKCNEYQFDLVYSALKKMVQDVPPPDVKGKTVLLKPNILSPKKPEFAICTHPVVVGAAVKIFLELGAKKALVGESPATANPTQAAKVTGMLSEITENGGEWVEFSNQVQVECKDGKLVKIFEFASPIAEADVVVSLSKLKSHQFMSYTGAMKNLFGLIVGLKKAQTHYRFQNKQDFATFLTDLNLAANPQYAIMDAIVGMEGPGGPGNGDPVQLGFLAASDNILALDWTCASIVGYNPMQIPNLKDALERNYWLQSPSDIKTVGAAIQEVTPKSFKIVKETSASISLQKMLPNWLNSLATLVFVKTPRFNPKKCIKCGKCAEICPPQILSFNKNKQIVMSDRKKCLHCFCCHEICPVEAITLHKF
jgi:uncharacterized protein (DUF362 family)/NAD-dependent dihydropyrimidine dehydrogenase PreA subunit